MIKYQDRETTELCGQAVIDFINAETTDKACLSLIQKIKKIFGFSKAFKKKAEKSFPYLYHATEHLEKAQQDFLSLYFKYWHVNSIINYALITLNLFLDKYDSLKNILILEAEDAYHKSVKISK